ncbi:spore germination protein GerPE [Halobacillus litoralis]|uniref:Spore germination protein GerPE n=2 Tax=Halobacillus litoralis TaxID=45668 RepID=A0A410MAB1_9BACI|nr:spore germination protein GerPE [Halobacillus litoralis]QAS51659.1 hypothetical protein HLI_05160 [Halobacillus litoralis]
MIKRMVYVDNVEVQSIAIASTFEIGDVHRAAPFSKVLAVQKEGANFVSDTFNFEDYPIFSLKPTPPLAPVNVESFFYQNRPIQVDDVRIIGASTAAVVQMGGIDHIDSLNYTKHFRLLEDEQ